MIIRIKKTRTSGDTGESGSMIQTKEDSGPGMNFKQKVVKSYQTKVKPGVKKAVSEASSDFKEMISR